MNYPQLQVARIPEKFAVALALAPDDIRYLSFHDSAASAEQMLQGVRTALDTGKVSLSQLELPITDVEAAPAIELKDIEEFPRIWRTNHGN